MSLLVAYMQHTKKQKTLKMEFSKGDVVSWPSILDGSKQSGIVIRYIPWGDYKIWNLLTGKETYVTKFELTLIARAEGDSERGESNE